MRVADKMLFDQSKHAIGKNRSELSELQNQAATQKRVTKPSDDPVAATRILSARTEINGNTQFIKNINQARGFLELSDQSLSELSEALMRAKELAISQSSDASANQQTRLTTANEIEQIHDQAVQIGNRKIGDRFIFGGYKTTTPPFAPNGRYAGDNGEMNIIINKEATVAMNIPGSLVFLGRDLKAPANVGPDPSRNFSPPSGAPHLGQGQQPDGSINKPQLSSSLRGPASLDSTQGVENGNVDPNSDMMATTNSQAQEGIGPNFSSSWSGGRVNVFKVLKELESGLRTNDKEGVQATLDKIDAALAQVVLARTEVGSRVGTINATMDSLQKAQVDTKGMASSLEDADTFELVSDINRTESTLQATLATSSKLIQPSLLDFLR